MELLDTQRLYALNLTLRLFHISNCWSFFGIALTLQLLTDKEMTLVRNTGRESTFIMKSKGKLLSLQRKMSS